MEVILMHRGPVSHKQPAPLNPDERREKTDLQSSSKVELLPLEMPRKEGKSSSSMQGLGRFQYSIQQGSTGLIVGLQAVMNGRVPVKARAVIPLVPWTQLNFYYHPALGRIQLSDTASGTGSSNFAETIPEYYVGRVVVTDTEALVYLRGRVKDIPGFKNILVKDEESSGIAFANYSSKVKRFIEETIARQEQLSRIDLHKQVSYLEAQVDVLTKIIVDSGIVQNPEYLKVLQEADRFSMCESLDAKLLRQKMQYKKIVRGIDKIC